MSADIFVSLPTVRTEGGESVVNIRYIVGILPRDEQSRVVLALTATTTWVDTTLSPRRVLEEIERAQYISSKNTDR